MGQSQGAAIAVLCGVGIEGVASHKNVQGSGTAFLFSQFFGRQKGVGGDAFLKINKYS